jgi:hypothetical protein
MTDLFGTEVIKPARQPALFDMDGPRESNECCEVCGRNLVETQSGYWTCPKGCLKLRESPRPAMIHPKAICSMERCARPAVQEITTDGGMAMHWRCEKHAESV